ncbi:MAG: YqgE/AlgH family protein [Betaproteobacteria bacterium]|nr:YqgE/AlgH family protein [Betaproteobacteria bacterium]
MKLRFTAWLAKTFGVAVLVASTSAALAQSAQDDDAILLVASPRLREPAFVHSVVLAAPIDNNRHVGVIINRPTRRTLSSLFPEHPPSKQVTGPVYFGGPMSSRALFALVRSESDPGGGSMLFLKNVFLARSMDTIDRIIEKTPNEARYFIGNVLWRPGELRAELDRGLWHAMNPLPEHVFRKEPDGLWEELMRTARAVTAHAGHALPVVQLH